jgi:hypothetical protein
MFPLIPVLALIGICGGGVTLAWYKSLTQEQQKEADQLSCDYAQKLFGKTFKELSQGQADQVARLTSQHFVN